MFANRSQVMECGAAAALWKGPKAKQHRSLGLRKNLL